MNRTMSVLEACPGVHSNQKKGGVNPTLRDVNLAPDRNDFQPHTKQRTLPVLAWQLVGEMPSQAKDRTDGA